MTQISLKSTVEPSIVRFSRLWQQFKRRSQPGWLCFRCVTEAPPRLDRHLTSEGEFLSVGVVLISNLRESGGFWNHPESRTQVWFCFFFKSLNNLMNKKRVVLFFTYLIPSEYLFSISPSCILYRTYDTYDDNRYHLSYHTRLYYSFYVLVIF